MVIKQRLTMQWAGWHSKKNRYNRTNESLGSEELYIFLRLQTGELTHKKERVEFEQKLEKATRLYKQEVDKNSDLTHKIKRSQDRQVRFFSIQVHIMLNNIINIINYMFF